MRFQPEPGSDQHRAEPIAAQASGLRFVIQARAADMNRRGVIEEFLFHGVLLEPGDGARPLGDGGPGPAADFQVTGKAFDVRAARLEQAQVVLLHQFAYCRRSRAYASRVKPVYPAQNPASASRSW